MIYWKLIVVTDQSYEVSCQDINFIPRGLAALLRVDTEKINLSGKIGE